MPLRTIHINTQNNWGGGEQQTLFLIRGLIQRGHEAILATRPDSPLGQCAQAEGIEIYPIKPINEVDPRVIWKLGRLLRQKHPQVLHMHSPHALFLGMLASALGPKVSRLVSRRVAQTIYRPMSFRLNWFKYRFGAERYIAVSNAIKDRLVKDGMKSSSIAVVHSGVEPQLSCEKNSQEFDQKLRKELDLPEEIPLILSIGILNPIKGQQVLLEAIRIVLSQIEVACVIVGEGAHQKSLEKLARDLDIHQRVRLTGFRKDALSHLGVCTIYAQPSINEGLGTSILDALLLEKPVVATRVGGIPEIIEHRQHGFLVPPGDSESMATALLEILRSPELGRQLARCGRQRVLRDFTVDKMVDKTLAIYESLASPCSPGNRMAKK